MPAPKRRSGQPVAAGNEVRFEDCWAKTTADGQPGISVRDHCLNVGCVAEALLALLPASLRALLPQGAATLAALHDIGKVSPGFQRKCPAWLKELGLADRALAEAWSARESDHAKVGQFTVQNLFGNPHLHPLAAALGAHHGRIKGETVHVDEPWEGQRRRLAAELIARFGPLPSDPVDEASLWFLAGLITVSDWIGSDERHFLHGRSQGISDARERARSALAAVGRKPIQVNQGARFGDLFPEIPQENDLQAAAMREGRKPGVYIIEGPMGCGKTEAALAVAYNLISAGGATGIFFALPTQTTSNRIHLRVHPFVNRISVDPAAVRLAHSNSWLLNREPPPKLRPASQDAEAIGHVRDGQSWFASAKRALLVPFGVGTIDQALLAVVAAKHFFVRQFGLAGKVVVLDEVHTYDLYTSTLIDSLVRRLRELHCTVVVLSATLTKARRRQLLGIEDGQPLSDAYPLLSAADGALQEVACAGPPRKTVAVRFAQTDPPVEEALDHAGDAQCVLWIRNTVDDAQTTYRALKNLNSQGGPAIALLHSRFPFFRREQLEATWMERLGKDTADRPKGCVLVSTQVAEQSVDIDADLLITDLAPTDMLLQRLGRLWRHDRSQRPCAYPELRIQAPPFPAAGLEQATANELRQALGKSGRVYAPYVLLRSLEQWHGKTTLTLPDDIRPTLEATYADPSPGEPAAWKELRRQLDQQKEKMALQARNATAIWHNPALPDEEGVQTRWGARPSTQLLLATRITPLGPHSVRLETPDGGSVTADARDWSFDAAKAIHRNSVPVPRWATAGRPEKPPTWLSNHVALPAAVALLRPNGEIQWPGGEQQTMLSYHPDQGIIINRERAARSPDTEFDESYD